MTDDDTNSDTGRGILLGIHAGCVGLIVGCFVLSATLLKGQTFYAGCVCGVGFWLWGKLGFKPAQVVLERMIYKQLGVSLDDVRQMSARPPPRDDVADEVTQ